MPGTSLENRLSDLVRAYLAPMFPERVVKREAPLYTPPTCQHRTGKVAWPGEGGALNPWKQDICLGRSTGVDDSTSFGFVPHVTMEAKVSYITDAMIVAAEKVARLRRIYPAMQAVFIKFNETDWGPTRKAWPLLREFDAYVPVRYAIDEAGLQLHPDDADRLAEVVRTLDGAATFAGTSLDTAYGANGWIRALGDLRDVVPDAKPATPPADEADE